VKLAEKLRAVLLVVGGTEVYHHSSELDINPFAEWLVYGSGSANNQACLLRYFVDFW
jgi:hypothetical protein